MRPKPFKLARLEKAGPFLRDEVSGLVWHEAFDRVLYADTDCSGAVYHSNYLRYFELGRTSLMRDLGIPYRGIEDAGYIYPVVNTAVNYHEMLTYDDDIVILTRPGRLERVKAAFDYVIMKKGSPRIVADGFTIHCALNSRRQPVPVDEATLEIWKKFPQ